MKRLKNSLKCWNKDSFGNLDDSIQVTVAEIKSLDDKGERGSFSEGDILKRRQLFDCFWKLSKMLQSLM